MAFSARSLEAPTLMLLVLGSLGSTGITSTERSEQTDKLADPNISLYREDPGFKENVFVWGPVTGLSLHSHTENELRPPEFKHTVPLDLCIYNDLVKNRLHA